ncbi:MAG TPA: FecR domain-containing protein [Planctomycetota bacterium]
MKPDDIAIDGLLRELARKGPGDDEAFVARVMGRRPKRRWLAAGLAAAALLALLWPASGPKPVVEGRVATAEGESRAIELADRSRVRIEENSELRVEAGRVELTRGQATFEVTKKPAGREFAVATEHGEIVVHGTRFTASVDAGALVVKVEEGCVEVRNAHGKATLLPGEHAVVRQDRAPDKKEKLFTEPLKTDIPPLEEKLDYDIVYVRARRAGDEKHKRFYTDFSQPVTLEPGADLMLLKRDGAEEPLVEGGDGAITDPMVSLDGQWVYYSRLYDLRKANQWTPPSAGADLFKIHVPTRKIVRLTNQVFDRNAGVDKAPSYGVYNMGACPLPGGRIVFTSNREGFKPSKGYPAIALQLFTMDDRDESIGEKDVAPPGLEKIGHLNIAGALHPVVLKDGRILFSTLESQGIRSEISWGIWTIHPDGSNWGPFISAFDPGGAANGFHFQTQLSDGAVIVEEYYNQNNSGFGAYIRVPADFPRFGPGYMNDPRNAPWRFGRYDNGKGKYYRMPFMPEGSISFTPFALNGEGEADKSVIGDKASPRVGKFTHPSGAPGNHLLTVYSPGPVNHQYTFLPQLDGGIYLAKDGKPVEQPSDLRLIKNDPNYNESWPRALVPYERIYGVKEPKTIARIANKEGVPFGFVGSSSLYKRESYPNGVVPEGKVTATYAGGKDPWKGLDAFTSHGNGMPINWHNQGGDAGLYENDEIHALRILAMEPTSDRQGGRKFASHANERLRVLGEIPVRKLEGGKQPVDPDGNPDTSFLAKIPADTAFTFQTLDKNGLVLNNSQTWHQVRPGETRNDCGGCHAHSQKPTLFSETAAARPDYPMWDLVARTPLLTTKAKDESKRAWDVADQTGLRFAKGVVDVEYKRDIRPILDRSCVACHSRKAEKPAGNLVLDADDEVISIEKHGKLPGTYVRLAQDERAKFGHKPVGYDSWGYPNASRYVRKLQSRRSLLVWKIFGRRLDGFSNDDHPSEPEPGAGTLVRAGEPVDLAKNRSRWDLDFLGSEMPPKEAVEKGKVQPLTDEDRRVIARWIDLGCPIDLDGGWWQDDNRPVVSLTADAGRVLLGLLDYGSGLEPESLRVTADVELDGVAAGDNLASRFKPLSPGVSEMKLSKAARLTVTVKDKQGNATRLERKVN